MEHTFFLYKCVGIDRTVGVIYRVKRYMHAFACKIMVVNLCIFKIYFDTFKFIYYYNLVIFKDFIFLR